MIDQFLPAASQLSGPYLMFQLAQDPHFPHSRDRKTFPVAVFLFDALEGHDLAVFRPGGLVNLMLTLFNTSSCVVPIR